MKELKYIKTVYFRYHKFWFQKYLTLRHFSTNYLQVADKSTHGQQLANRLFNYKNDPCSYYMMKVLKFKYVSNLTEHSQLNDKGVHLLDSKNVIYLL